jgi:hypothetical protein
MSYFFHPGFRLSLHDLRLQNSQNSLQIEQIQPKSGRLKCEIIFARTLTYFDDLSLSTLVPILYTAYKIRCDSYHIKNMKPVTWIGGISTSGENAGVGIT